VRCAVVADKTGSAGHRVRRVLVWQRVRTFGIVVVVRPPTAGGRPRQSYGRGRGLVRRIGDGRRARTGGHHGDAPAQDGGPGGGGGGRQLAVHVEAVQQSGAHRAPARRHRRRHCPPVDPGIVPLGRVQARVAVVAAEHQQPAVQFDHVVGGPATHDKTAHINKIPTCYCGPRTV